MKTKLTVPIAVPRRSRTRWVLWSFGTIALAACVAGLLYFARDYWPEDGISRYNYRRIELGMTTAHVEEIIGLPPGTHRTKHAKGGSHAAGNFGRKIAEVGVLPTEGYQLADGRNDTIRQWWGTYHAIGIAVNEHDVVVGKYLIEVRW